MGHGREKSERENSVIPSPNQVVCPVCGGSGEVYVANGNFLTDCQRCYGEGVVERSRM